MADTTSTLNALIRARRPFKKFTMEGEDGDELTLYARIPGSGEQNEIDNLFNAAYKAERDKIEADQSELALFQRSVAKQDIDEIINYIVEADSGDFEYDAQRILDNPTAEEVEAKAKELKEARKAEMKVAYNKEDLVTEALERRSHILSYTAATKAILRHVVVFTVHDENKERLFNCVEDLNEVPEQVIAELSTKASAALREKEAPKDNPLEPAASKPSDAPSSSPEEPEAVT